MIARKRFFCMLLAGSAVALYVGCQAPGGAQPAGASPQQSPSGAKDKPGTETPLDLPPSKIEARTYLAAGRLHESQNRPQLAIEQYQHALAEDPGNVHILSRIAYLCDTTGNSAAAEKAWVEAVKQQPDNAVLQNNLAFSYILRQRWDKAEPALVQAIDLKPDFARARINLAMVLSQTNRFDDALRQFQRVLPPEEAYYNIGLMYQSKRKSVEAAEAYKRAVELNPKLVAAQEQLKRMPAEVLGAADRRIQEANAAAELAAAAAEPAESVSEAETSPEDATATRPAESAATVPEPLPVLDWPDDYLMGMMADVEPWECSTEAGGSQIAAAVRVTPATQPANTSLVDDPEISGQTSLLQTDTIDPSVLELDLVALTGDSGFVGPERRFISLDAILASRLDSLLPPWQRSPDMIESLLFEPMLVTDGEEGIDFPDWQASPPAWDLGYPDPTSERRVLDKTAEPR